MNRLPDTLESLSAPPSDGPVVVGYSGGLDSTVLLHWLAGQPAVRARGLRALHVDHQLQADSARWAEHCRQQCAALDIALDVIRVAVDDDGSGPEGAARQARWRAFEHTIDPITDVLALAHHQDDQTETVLLRLLRGAGPAGLAAMRPLTRRANGLRVWRPLLAVPRQAVLAWARHRQLAWIEDPSNQSPCFDRNHLRHTIMPGLRARWPNLDQSLIHVAQRQADAFALEQLVARQVLAQAMTDHDHSLHLAPLRNAPREARWAALRHWLAGQGAADVGTNRLQRIDDELIGAAANATPRIELGACLLRRHRDRLFALAPDADQPLDYRLPWDGLSPLALPGDVGTLSIEPAPAQPLALVVSTRRGGEALRLRADGPRRKLKHLLQESGIPPWLRDRWPVLWLDDEPAGFADAIMDARLSQRLTGHVVRLRPTTPAESAATTD